MRRQTKKSKTKTRASRGDLIIKSRGLGPIKRTLRSGLRGSIGSGSLSEARKHIITTKRHNSVLKLFETSKIKPNQSIKPINPINPNKQSKASKASKPNKANKANKPKKPIRTGELAEFIDNMDEETILKFKRAYQFKIASALISVPVILLFLYLMLKI